MLELPSPKNYTDAVTMGPMHSPAVTRLYNVGQVI
jgi:hypothetical protein